MLESGDLGFLARELGLEDEGGALVFEKLRSEFLDFNLSFRNLLLELIDLRYLAFDLLVLHRLYLFSLLLLVLELSFHGLESSFFFLEPLPHALLHYLVRVQFPLLITVLSFEQLKFIGEYLYLLGAVCLRCIL